MMKVSSVPPFYYKDKTYKILSPKYQFASLNRCNCVKYHVVKSNVFDQHQHLLNGVTDSLSIYYNEIFAPYSFRNFSNNISDDAVVDYIKDYIKIRELVSLPNIEKNNIKCCYEFIKDYVTSEIKVYISLSLSELKTIIASQYPEINLIDILSFDKKSYKFIHEYIRSIAEEYSDLMRDSFKSRRFNCDNILDIIIDFENDNIKIETDERNLTLSQYYNCNYYDYFNAHEIAVPDKYNKKFDKFFEFDVSFDNDNPIYDKTKKHFSALYWLGITDANSIAYNVHYKHRLPPYIVSEYERFIQCTKNLKIQKISRIRFMKHNKPDSIIIGIKYKNYIGG